MNKLIDSNWFQSFINWYFKFKLAFGRADGYLGLPLDIVNKFMVLAIALKVFGITNWWLLGIIFAIGISIYCVVGYLDLKYRLMDKEISLHNKYNPEISLIYKKLKGDGK